jgi:hypothetical protein
MAIEPAPANPDAAQPLIEVLMAWVLLGAWAGAAATGLRRRPQALNWAAAVCGLTVVLTIGCPASGHHTIGMWWFGELAAGLAATAIALGALMHRTGRGSR